MTVREKETVLDEKIIQRTEEVSDPVTGEPTIQTFEYVEKVIEREVKKSKICNYFDCFVLYISLRMYLDQIFLHRPTFMKWFEFYSTLHCLPLYPISFIIWILWFNSKIQFLHIDTYAASQVFDRRKAQFTFDLKSVTECSNKSLFISHVLLSYGSCVFTLYLLSLYTWNE